MTFTFLNRKNKFFKCVLACLLIIEAPCSFSQQTAVDTLLSELNTAKEDTDKVNILNQLCWDLKYKDPEKALIYGKQGLALGEQSGFKKGIAISLNNIGIVYMFQGNYEKAIDFYLQALKNREQLGDKDAIAASFSNIGVAYMYQGDYEKALNFYFRSLEIREKIKDKNGIAACLGNIGIIYYYQKNYEKAIEYYLQSLKTVEELGNKQLIGSTLNNIGICYMEQHNYEKAIEYYLKSLKISEELGNKNLIAACFSNLGELNGLRGYYSLALKYSFKALKVAEELGDRNTMALTFNNIGEFYKKQSDLSGDKAGYEKAIIHSQKSLDIAKEIGAKEAVKNACQTLAEVYAKQNYFKNAYEYHQLYAEVKDTIFNEKTSKQISEMQTKYETEKKEKEIEILSKEKQLQALDLKRREAEVKKQKILRNAFIGGLIFALLLAFLLYNRYQFKRKANAQLAIKNQQITDSIDYAKRIQQSILIPENEIQKFLPDYFIYNQPKDIVSGDFYWFSRQKDNSVIAVVDCTGHGVPGAFMSMIGNSLLNEIVNEKQITYPAEILKQLHLGITTCLHQSKEDARSQHDGMDMVLCVIDHKNNLVRFAGAMNPLYVVQDGSLKVIKADIQPIGGTVLKSDKNGIREFTNHEIPVHKDMTIYMCTDGYMHQFGGDGKKIYGSQRFMQLLLDIHGMDMQQQKKSLIKAMEDWRTSPGQDAEPCKQIDDMLVFGVRV